MNAQVHPFRAFGQRGRIHLTQQDLNYAGYNSKLVWGKELRTIGAMARLDELGLAARWNREGALRCQRVDQVLGRRLVKSGRLAVRAS
jgi:hypothetical protein